ncbi:MAG TPA: carbohydrate ABC transporter permease [Clostridia bacterium]|jgi:multiple sugar transport system permease protein|nr:carbohydrate ABC transporter permease [Clostridia bacterium]HPY43300.1 carbohydrate ABC transporter permease [Clostridia bacterium]HQA97073.1 carbohydrate ABC transporter permease [Clostridia bacterium]HQO56171.1 carbohydrate ABC transporter permease [Clostridia bacterium]
MSIKIRIRRRPRSVSTLLSTLVLVLICALVLLPIVMTFLYSYFPMSEMKAFLGTRNNYLQERFMDILLAPSIVSLRQYYDLLIDKPVYLQLFMNSVKYTLAILAGQAVFIPTLAYALSRFRFKGRELLFFMILMLMLLPFQVTMAPSVLTMRALGLMNTPWAVILPMMFSPFYIFLVRQFMISIPGEMMEAGLMDGAGTIRSFFHVVLPLSKPILGAAAALSFADSWNLVEQPLIYLSSTQNAMPLSVMFNIFSSSEQGVVFAAAALYILPSLLIYSYFQEDILLGIQLSDMK